MSAVLITPEAMRDPDAPYCRLLAEAGFEFRFPTTPDMARGKLSEAETIEQLQGISAVIASGESYTPTVLDGLPELRVVARAGVGYDRVDVPACSERHVVVTITPNANHDAVAELTLALMFAAAKRVLPNDRRTREGHWPRAPLGAIRGKTLGIVGLGRIGRSLARRAVSLGMQVVAYDAMPNAEAARALDVRLVDFEQLLEQSDYVSLHCPLTPETRGLFGRQTLAKMKRGSTLINMARGQLVVEKDLLAALEAEHLAAAALDVFEQEPPGADNPLWKLENVVVSPHMAGMDELSGVGMGVEAAQAIIDLSQGKWPAGAIVNEQLRDGWTWSR